MKLSGIGMVLVTIRLKIEGLLTQLMVAVMGFLLLQCNLEVVRERKERLILILENLVGRFKLNFVDHPPLDLVTIQLNMLVLVLVTTLLRSQSDKLRFLVQKSRSILSH